MVHSKKKTEEQRLKSQTDDNECSCTLLLKDSSDVTNITLSGKLFHTWTAVWMNVWLNRSVHWYCKSMRWHWHAGVGGSCDNIRPSKQSTMVCRAFTGVHFVEESNCCHLTSLVERWDVQFYPSLIYIHTNNSKWHLPDRVQKSKCSRAGTHPW